MYAQSYGRFSTGTADRTIVASWPGYQTGDTVFETATGRRISVSGSSTVPTGYIWDTSSTSTPRQDLYVTAFVRIAPEEEPPKRPRYTDPAPRPTPYTPKVRPGFRVTQRPEFHARSNPR